MLVVLNGIPKIINYFCDTGCKRRKIHVTTITRQLFGRSIAHVLMAFSRRAQAARLEEEFMIQNLRQFGIVNNELTEQCFSSCIGAASERQLTNEEGTCIESCAEKLISASVRVMLKAAEMNPMGIGGGEQNNLTANQLAQTTTLPNS